MGNDRKEETFDDLNNQLTRMDLQWFAEEGEAGPTGDGGEGDTGSGDTAGGGTGGEQGETPKGPEGDAGQAGEEASGGEPGGVEKPGWMAGLKADLRENEVLAGHKTVTDLAKAYLESGPAEGSVKIPGDDASEDEIEAYREAMGIPGKPEEYELKVGDDTLIGKDADQVEGLKKTAAEMGLTQDQAQKLFETQDQQAKAYMEQALKESQDNTKKAMDAMRKEWGGDYDKKMATAQKTTRKLFGEDFAKYLDDSGLGNDARMIKAMATLGETISEDSLPGAVQGVRQSSEITFKDLE